jgi:hypothetical protein
MLRERFFEPVARKYKISPYSPFLRNNLQPGSSDTLVIKHTEEVDIAGEPAFALHILLIYENQMGHVYDTYYRTRCDILPAQPGMKKTAADASALKIRLAKRDILRFTYPRISYRRYDQEGTTYICDYHRDLIEDFRMNMCGFR